MTKQDLLRRVIEVLTREKKSAEQSFETTRRAAIEAPGAMQSHSDTTKWQMSRLAEGIQRSINEKGLAIRTLDALIYSGLPSDVEVVRVGSVVEVCNEHNEREIYFVLPAGSGIKVADDDRTILVITPQAPFALALFGKRQGEIAQLQIGSRHRELTIVDIQ